MVVIGCKLCGFTCVFMCCVSVLSVHVYVCAYVSCHLVRFPYVCVYARHRCLYEFRMF